MAQLTVRNVAEQVVRALKRKAAAHGCSAEAEHRESSGTHFSREMRISPLGPELFGSGFDPRWAAAKSYGPTVDRDGAA